MSIDKKNLFEHKQIRQRCCTISRTYLLRFRARVMDFVVKPLTASVCYVFANSFIVCDDLIHYYCLNTTQLSILLVFDSHYTGWAKSSLTICLFVKITMQGLIIDHTLALVRHRWAASSGPRKLRGKQILVKTAQLSYDIVGHFPVLLKRKSRCNFLVG